MESAPASWIRLRITAKDAASTTPAWSVGECRQSSKQGHQGSLVMSAKAGASCLPLHTRLRGCPRSSDGRNGRYGSFVRSAKECVASDRRFRSAHDARLDRLRPLRTFCRFQSYVDFRFPATFSAFATGRSFAHVRRLPCPGFRRPHDQFPPASRFYQSASFPTSIADPPNVARQRRLPTRCGIAFCKKSPRHPLPQSHGPSDVCRYREIDHRRIGARSGLARLLFRRLPACRSSSGPQFLNSRLPPFSSIGHGRLGGPRLH